MIVTVVPWQRIGPRCVDGRRVEPPSADGICASRPVGLVVDPVGVLLSISLMTVLNIVPESRPAIGWAGSVKGVAVSPMD